MGKRLKGMPKVARAAVAALAPQAGRVPSSYEDACKQDLQHPDQTSSRFRSRPERKLATTDQRGLLAPLSLRLTTTCKQKPAQTQPKSQGAGMDSRPQGKASRSGRSEGKRFIPEHQAKRSKRRQTPKLPRQQLPR